jgi:hypothetical protein
MMLVMAAGPMAGLALGVLVTAAVRVAPRGALPADAVSDALFVTFGWSLMNLLPLGGMDGHGLLEAATTVVLGRPAAATGRFVGAMALLTIAVATAVAGWLEATFMVVFVAFVTLVPLGVVSRLFGVGPGQRPAARPGAPRGGAVRSAPSHAAAVTWLVGQTRAPVGPVGRGQRL